jgi:putative MATE family efflux protein
MVSTAFTTGLHLVDLWFIARLGTVETAAASTSSSLVRIITGLGTGTAAAVLALSARFFGAGQRKHVTIIAVHGIGMALVVGAVACGAVGLFVRPLLFVFTREAAVIAAGVEYLTFMLPGLVLMFGYLSAAAVFQGCGDTKTPLQVIAGANVLNVLLDRVLIFGLGPVPAMGIAGAGLASLVGSGLAATVGIGLLARRTSPLERVASKEWKPDRALIANILRVAAPAAGQQMMRPITGMALLSMVAFYGTSAIAAFGIGLRITGFSMVFGMGLTAAVSTLVGQALGRGGVEEARRAVRVGLTVGGVVYTVIGLAYLTLARPLMGAFLPEPDVLRQGAMYLRVLAPAFLTVGAMNVLNGTFQGSGDTAALMQTSLLANVPVKLGLALVLGFVWPSQLYGIWLAISLSVLVETTLLFAWYRQGRWYKRRTVEWEGRSAAEA